MTNLTGECLHQFEKWYLAKRKKSFSLNYLQMIVAFFGNGNNAHWKAFECSPPEMQWGVMVDFFDSVGINVCLFTYTFSNKKTLYRGQVENSPCKTMPTRPEARTKALEKANILFNNK